RKHQSAAPRFAPAAGFPTGLSLAAQRFPQCSLWASRAAGRMTHLHTRPPLRLAVMRPITCGCCDQSFVLDRAMAGPPTTVPDRGKFVGVRCLFCHEPLTVKLPDDADPGGKLLCPRPS